MENDIAKSFASCAGRVCGDPRKGEESIKGQFARFQVEVSIYEPLIKGCYLKNQEGELEWIELKYEKTPSLCSKCGAISHRNEVCEDINLEGSDHTQELVAGQEVRPMMEGNSAGIEPEDGNSGRRAANSVAGDRPRSITEIGKSTDAIECEATREGRRNLGKGKEVSLGKEKRQIGGELMLEKKEGLNLVDLTDAKWMESGQLAEYNGAEERRIVVRQVDNSKLGRSTRKNSKGNKESGSGKTTERKQKTADKIVHFHPYLRSNEAVPEHEARGTIGGEKETVKAAMQPRR